MSHQLQLKKNHPQRMLLYIQLQNFVMALNRNRVYHAYVESKLEHLQNYKFHLFHRYKTPILYLEYKSEYSKLLLHSRYRLKEFVIFYFLFFIFYKV